MHQSFRTALATLLLFAVVLTGCGGGGGSSGDGTGSSGGNPPSVSSIAISGTSTPLPLWHGRQLVATAIYTDGSTRRLTGGVEWSSDNSTVASVDSATGTVTALDNGTVTVSARYASATGTGQLTVHTPQLVPYTPPRYRLTDLGTLPNLPVTFQSIYGTAMNDSGVVIGHVQVGGHQTGFIWSNGVMTDWSEFNSGEPCGMPCFGGINASGVVVGKDNSGAFIWQTGVRTSIAAPMNYSFAASPTGINSSGAIVGSKATDGPVQISGWVLTEGAITYTGSLGGPQSEALAINDAGTVVGRANTSHYDLHAFSWQAGVITDLGVQLPSLPYLFASPTMSATAINNNGVIAGHSSRVPVVWDHGESYALPGDGPVSAINDSGLMVGEGAVLYAYGHTFDLNTLIDANDPLAPYVSLRWGNWITEGGLILATGTDTRVEAGYRAYILTPQ